MSAWVDTHSHLQDEAFGGPGELGVEAVLEHATVAGIERVVVCGWDLASSLAALELAARHPMLAPTVGFQPHDTAAVTPTMLEELAHLAALPQVVAVGEIGLDAHWDVSPMERQREMLDQQLLISVKLGKPVSVHSRKAETLLVAPLAAHASAWRTAGHDGAPGVLHCFGGTLEQAQPFVDAGYLISVAANVTYPKNEQGRRLAAGVPLDHLVVETDSPYLPPQGLRGRRNEPANVVAVGEAVAAVRGLRRDEVAAATTTNARRLFRLASADGRERAA